MYWICVSFSGSNVLSNLRYQGDVMKGARKRIIDIANTLGLSNTTISLIEKRARQDKLILFGGMFFTLFVITIVIVYFTWLHGNVVKCWDSL